MTSFSFIFITIRYFSEQTFCMHTIIITLYYVEYKNQSRKLYRKKIYDYVLYFAQVWPTYTYFIEINCVREETQSKSTYRPLVVF